MHHACTHGDLSYLPIHPICPTVASHVGAPVLRLARCRACPSGCRCTWLAPSPGGAWCWIQGLDEAESEALPSVTRPPAHLTGRQHPAPGSDEAQAGALWRCLPTCRATFAGAEQTVGLLCRLLCLPAPSPQPRIAPLPSISLYAGVTLASPGTARECFSLQHQGWGSAGQHLGSSAGRCIVPI